MNLINSREIESSRISIVEILSKDRDIYLYMGDTDCFIIKEYMNREKPDYCALISSSDNTLKIENGIKPSFGVFQIGFKAHLEIYIPKTYSEKISIKSEDCNVHCTISDTIKDITVSAKDGNISISLPKRSIFNFSAHLSDGKLETPFSDKLSKSVTDKNIIQGIIGDVGNNITTNSISLSMKDGAIAVKWIDE